MTFVSGAAALGDLTRRLLPDGGERAYTADELAEIADVLDAAVEWRAGRLPLGQFAALGTLQPRRWSTKEITCHGRDREGYTRFVAMVWARAAGDGRVPALTAALDALRDWDWGAR